MDDPLLWGLALCALGAILFRLVGTAAEDFSPTKLEEFAEKSARKKNTAIFISFRERVILAMSALSLMANVGTVLFISARMSLFSESDNIQIILALLLSFMFVVIFGFVIPRTVARRDPEKIVYACFPLALNLYYLLFPLIVMMELLEKALEHMMGPKPQDNPDDKEDEILSIIEDIEKEGSIEKDERQMIKNIFELDNVQVSDVMTPRTDVVFADKKMSIHDAIRIAHEKGMSRLPVFDETRDNVVGIFYIRDLLKHITPDIKFPPLSECVRKPFFVPESKRVDEMLEEFRRSKVHIAIVVDEYGGTSGLITVEDILEEIVGEIQDEHDPDLVEGVRQLNQNDIEADGRTQIYDINEQLDTSIPEEEDAITIGGFIISRLGKVPKAGEILDFENLKITVLDADARRVKRVRVSKNTTGTES